MKFLFSKIRSNVFLKEVYPVFLYILLLIAWGITGLGIQPKVSRAQVRPQPWAESRMELNKNPMPDFFVTTLHGCCEKNSAHETR